MPAQFGMVFICSRCLRASPPRALSSARHIPAASSRRRSIVSKGFDGRKALRGLNAERQKGPPAATSKSDAQPFSTPLTPSPEPLETNEKPSPKAKTQSFDQPGKSLKALAWLKGKDPPMALQEDEYPAWLWTLLDEQKSNSKEAGATFNQYQGTRKQRQRARKEAAKQAKLYPDANVPKVPLHEQSIDLPSGDGSVQSAIQALAAREELTDAMADARRKSIKEANYLKGMR